MFPYFIEEYEHLLLQLWFLSQNVDLHIFIVYILGQHQRASVSLIVIEEYSIMPLMLKSYPTYSLCVAAICEENPYLLNYGMMYFSAK